MPGGYQCQDKVIENCLPGLQFNSETSLCEGAFSLASLFIEKQFSLLFHS